MATLTENGQNKQVECITNVIHIKNELKFDWMNSLITCRRLTNVINAD